MLQLPQCLGFDLPDALARDRELLTYLFQRVVLVHADPEAHAQDALFPRCERGEHARRSLAQVRLDSCVDRLERVLVLDEVAEAAVILVPDGGLDGERLLRKPEDSTHPFQRHAQLFGKLLGGRFTADLVEHLPRCAEYLVGHLNHLQGNTASTRLDSDSTTTRLENP